jgi:hypothetical protein
MRLWRESAAYKREEEVERIGELIGAGQVSSHCRAPASAGFYSLSASSSASRSSAGLTRPLCLKTSAPERS